MAWLGLALGLAAGACSGGYPLPPTRCDEWCDVTKGMTCRTYYQPASCVSQCEQAQFDAKECDAELDAILTCFRTTPRATNQLCVYDGTVNACEPQFEALTVCVGYLKINNLDR